MKKKKSTFALGVDGMCEDEDEDEKQQDGMERKGDWEESTFYMINGLQMANWEGPVSNLARHPKTPRCKIGGYSRRSIV